MGAYLRFVRRHIFGVVVAEYIFGYAYPRMEPVWRFFIAGGFVTIVFYSFLIPLADGIGLSYWLAAPLAFIPSFTLSFTLHRRWIFKHADPTLKSRHLRHFFVKQVSLFATKASAVGYIAAYFGIWYLHIQLAETACIGIFSGLWSWYIFRRRT